MRNFNMGKMAALVALSPRYTAMLDDNVALLAVTLHGGWYKSHTSLLKFWHRCLVESPTLRCFGQYKTSSTRLGLSGYLTLEMHNFIQNQSDSKDW